MNNFNTKENVSKIKALEAISDSEWTYCAMHDTLDKCLTAINLGTLNSGWYKPTYVLIDGFIYIINQDGSLFCEQRIKVVSGSYQIEDMNVKAWNRFEIIYNKLLNKTNE